MTNLFCNLARGNVMKTHLGLKSGQIGKEYTLGQDYSHVQCTLSKDSKTKVKAGDFVALFPAVEIDPKRCKVMVVPNSVLATVGSISYQSLIEPGDKHALGISLKAERDFDLTELDYFVRLYVIFG